MEIDPLLEIRAIREIISWDSQLSADIMILADADSWRDQI